MVFSFIMGYQICLSTQKWFNCCDHFVIYPFWTKKQVVAKLLIPLLHSSPHHIIKQLCFLQTWTMIRYYQWIIREESKTNWKKINKFAIRRWTPPPLPPIAITSIFHLRKLYYQGLTTAVLDIKNTCIIGWRKPKGRRDALPLWQMSYHFSFLCDLYHNPWLATIC